MQYRDAIIIEGYLEKQSPTVFKIYQTRYFAYRNMGQFLIWFKKKPTSINDVPKGIMKTRGIEILQDDQVDERVFKLYYETRQFILRADNRQTKERWLKSIQVVQEHFKKAEKNQKMKVKQDDSTIKKTWRWNDLNGQVTQKIRIENEQLLLNEGEDNTLQNANKTISEFFNKKIGFQVQRNIIFGMLTTKNYFLCSQTKLYFLFSQFNLYDQKDDLMNQKISAFLRQIQRQKQVKTKVSKADSDSDDSQPDLRKNEGQKKEGLDINRLYELDLKTKQISLNLSLIDINKWQESVQERPFSLAVNYSVFKDDDDQQREMVLMSNYLSEIKKWNKAFEIIFQRYSIRKQRQALNEKRFVKYEIKLVKIDEEPEWRVMGTSNSPDYVYLNRDQVKVSGHIFELANINSSIKSQKLEIVFKQKGEDVKKEALITKFQLRENRKLEIVFQAKQIQKEFRKRLKKNIKKIEPTKKGQQINMQPPKSQLQVNESTYFMDKKIKERSGSIKVNFYEMMEREVSVAAIQRPVKNQSAFDKFLNMFCGAPKDQNWSLNS